MASTTDVEVVEVVELDLSRRQTIVHRHPLTSHLPPIALDIPIAASYVASVIASWPTHGPWLPSANRESRPWSNSARETTLSARPNRAGQHLLGVVLLAGTLLVGPQLGGGPSSRDPVSVTSSAPVQDSLITSIADLQQQLEERPKDDAKWHTSSRRA